MLRDGRLAELADVLAARLVAVDVSTRQGWQTARHLEVYGEEEEGSAPPHILLSAQRHARAVEKAGGKGSWTRGQSWSGGDWNYEQRPKGKGKEAKGKGKKGKAKGKGNKGQWSYWGSDKDKPSDKNKEGKGDA